MKRNVLGVMCAAMLLAGAAGVWAEPVVFWASDPVQPNETVVAQGGGLATARYVEVARVSDSGKRLRMPLKPTRVPALQPSDCSVKFTLPASLKPGLFAFQVVTKEGKSAPYILNEPQVWWAQQLPPVEDAPRGGVFAFGNCFFLEGVRETYISLEGPRKVTLPAMLGRIPGDRGGWKLIAAFEDEVPPGEYQVRVHNGFGGDLGVVRAGEAPYTRAGSLAQKVFDVRDFGADGTGAKDDTAAVQAALTAAEKNGGGVVFFPRGRYQVTSTLTIPRFTTLRCEEQGLADVFWPDRQDPLPVQIRGTNSFAIENLTLSCRNYAKFLVADQTGAEAGDVRLRHVVIRAERYMGHLDNAEIDRRNRTAGGWSAPLLTLGGKNVEVTHCDLHSSGMALVLSRVRGGLFWGNTFYNGHGGWYSIMGSDGLIFEGNTIMGGDLTATGGGINCLDGSSCSQNVYFARNRLENFFGWDREAMTSDAGGGCYIGKIAAAAGSTLTLAEAPKWGGRDWKGAAIFLLSGKGAGQYRQIMSYDGASVTVDRPLDVAPDGTTQASITALQRNYILASNDFSDGTVAIQFYGISINHIVAENTSARCGGFHNMGLNYYGYQPSWYCQYFGNKITVGNGMCGPLNELPPRDSSLGVYGWPSGAYQDVMARCTIFRDNDLQNNARLEVVGRVADTLFEGNKVANANEGVSVDGLATGTMLRGNEMQRVVSPFNGAGMSRTLLHPAERLLGRLQAAKALLVAQRRNVPAQWEKLVEAAQRLALRPWDDPALPGECQAIQRQALETVPGEPALTPELARALLGLEVSVAADPALTEALASGGGGRGAVALRASLATDAPPIQLSSRCPGDTGCKAESLAPFDLEPGKTVERQCQVTVPAGSWGARRETMELTVAVGDGTWTVAVPVRLGSGEVRDWLIVGPFANPEKKALDPSSYPPEERLDVSASYQGLSGKVAWQQAQLKGDKLHFGARLGVNENATAYAVAAVRADAETLATLNLWANHGVQLWLNGETVLMQAEDQKAETAKTVTLKPGNNIMLVKSSATTPPWQVSLEIEEQGAGGHVSVIPADKLAMLVELNPPPPPPTFEGDLSHAAGVAWQLACEDRFDGTALGPSWRVASGEWTVSGGTLKGKGQAFLSLTKKLSAPVRIEYRARADAPTDLSAFWLEAPPDYNTGILMAFAAQDASRIDILGENGATATGPQATTTPGKWRHVIAQILPSGVVQLIVDEKLVLEHRQTTPLTGARYPGIWTWGQGEFDDVRIYSGVK